MRIVRPVVLVALVTLLASCTTWEAEVSYIPRAPLASTPRDARLRVGSFNIHYDGIGEESWVWQDRRDRVVAAILAESPDLVGLQEVCTWDGMDMLSSRQVPDLERSLAEHGYALSGARPLDRIESSNPIVYRTDALEEIDSGAIFFKRDPLMAPEGTMENLSARFGRWTRFRILNGDAAGEELVVLNAHYNPIRFGHRLRSSSILAEYLPDIAADARLIVTGDLNAFPTWSSVKRLTTRLSLTDALADQGVTGGTLHRGRESFRWGRIDYVLTDESIDVEDAWISQVRPDGVFPSDHFGVYADLRL